MDELRAAGALDVPKAWRKSLGEDKHLFGSFDDEEALAPDDRDHDEVDSDGDALSG